MKSQDIIDLNKKRINNNSRFFSVDDIRLLNYIIEISILMPFRLELWQLSDHQLFYEKFISSPKIYFTLGDLNAFDELLKESDSGLEPLGEIKIGNICQKLIECDFIKIIEEKEDTYAFTESGYVNFYLFQEMIFKYDDSDDHGLLDYFDEEDNSEE